MSITAGESTTETQAVDTPPMVNAEELAKQIVQNVFANLPQQPNQTPVQAEARRSELEAKADELLKSERIDKDVMPVMLDLVQAMRKDLTKEQQDAMLQQAQQQQTKAVHQELGRLIERYAATSPDPELIRELKISIAEKAIGEYNSNGSLVRRYKDTGEVDWSEFDKIVVKHVNKWSKKGEGKDDKPAGGPAMKNSAPSGGAAEVTRQMDKDTLDEKTREIFNSQVQFGMKNMRQSREEAEKRALELIQRAESKKTAVKR